MRDGVDVLVVVLGLGLTTVTGCADPFAADPAAAAPRPVANTQRPSADEGAANRSAFVLDERFTARAAQIATGFEATTKIGDWPKWAPTMCSAPPPPGALMSRSADTDGHGGKLYYLYLHEPVAYLTTPRPTQPVGQAIVKRSYAAEPVDRGADDDLRALTRSGTVVRRGDRWFRIGTERELFIMFKLDPDTPGTDRGWVYATTTPDGKRVTSAGRVGRCMRCHTDAGPDRIFGPVAEGHLKSLGGDARALAADAAAGW